MLAERQRLCPSNVDPWAEARGPREPEKFLQRVHPLTLVSSSSIHKILSKPYLLSADGQPKNNCKKKFVEFAL